MSVEQSPIQLEEYRNYFERATERTDSISAEHSRTYRKSLEQLWEESDCFTQNVMDHPLWPITHLWIRFNMKLWDGI